MIAKAGKRPFSNYKSAALPTELCRQKNCPSGSDRLRLGAPETSATFGVEQPAECLRMKTTECSAL